MREDMELVGRKSEDPSLGWPLDYNPQNLTFGLKTKGGELVTVARLKHIQKPLECYYLQQVRTDERFRGEGYAGDLMQQVTDIFRSTFRRRGARKEVCIAYQLIGDPLVDPEGVEYGKRARSLLTGTGEWRNVRPPKSYEEYPNIWALNLPKEDEKKAFEVIRRLKDKDEL